MPSARPASESSASLTRAPSGRSSTTSGAPARSRSMANRRTVTSTAQMLRAGSGAAGRRVRSTRAATTPPIAPNRWPCHEIPSCGSSPASSAPPHSTRHHGADRDLHRAAVEQAARDQVGGVAEHHPARAEVDRVRRRDQPGAEPADERHDRGHADAAATPPRARSPPPSRRTGTVLATRWPKPTCRKGAATHAVEPVDVARLDAEPVEPVVERRVDDLEHPHERDDAPAPAGSPERILPCGWPPPLTINRASRRSSARTIRAASRTRASRSSTRTDRGT